VICPSQNFITSIMLKTRWRGHFLGQEDMRAKFCQGNLKERGYLKYLDLDGTVILKYMLKEQGGLVHLKIGKSGGVLLYRVGASDYIKSRIIQGC